MRRDPAHLIRLAIWCAGLIFISPAPAEEVGGTRVHVLPGGTVMEIAGPLVGDVGAEVRGALAAHPAIRLVRLDSEGGIIAIGMAVQAAILQRALDTEVRGICNSACTIAFLGGARRAAGPAAKFGFHGVADADGGGLAARLIVRGLYLHAGVAADFADRALAMPHEQMWFPTDAELREAGVVTAAAPPR